MQQDQNEQQPLRGPRGGNSGMSIPPGADLDDGYATDDVPADEPMEPGSDLPEPESPESGPAESGSAD